MPRALPRYTIALKRRTEDAVELEPDTNVRLAIRRGRKMLKLNPPYAQLTIRGWQPGDTSKRGRIEYQAHLSPDGKIIVAEER